MAQAARGDSIRCTGQIVREIAIRSTPPNFGRIVQRSRLLGDAVRKIHVDTRASVIHRFLLLDEGKPCTEARRLESERILLSQPYIASATVRAYADSGNTVRIEVTTVDEVSTIVSALFTAPSPHVRAFGVGSRNLAGDAIYAAVNYHAGLFYRDRYSAALTDYQFAGRPYQFSVGGERSELGGFWWSQLSLPYLTDYQRLAWRINGGSGESYYQLVRGDAPRAALRLAHSFADVGGVLRLGEPGHLGLVGASVSSDRHEPTSPQQIISDTGVVLDVDQTLAGRYPRHHTARVNALLGIRNVHFTRVVGFDALTAPQDLRTGFQLGALLGRSVKALGSSENDFFMSTDAYVGGGTQRLFAAFDARGEGRRSFDENRWDGLLTSARWIGYLKLHPSHTMLTSLEWGAGWRQRVPFQLMLADRNGGLPGYRYSLAAGGRRAVARMEQRWTWGTPPGGLGDVAAALFVTGGRLWAGDVPFGVTTPMRYSAGLALLAAVPAHTQHIWRIDLAFPLTPGGRGLEVRFSQFGGSRGVWREPDDISQARESTVPTSIFNWP